jgi:hypothetical protein
MIRWAALCLVPVALSACGAERAHNYAAAAAKVEAERANRFANEVTCYDCDGFEGLAFNASLEKARRERAAGNVASGSRHR